MTESAFEIFVILALILINGFFALAEMAIVASKKVRLEHLAQREGRRARVALKLHQEPDAFLSTVQVGITLIGVLTGAFGGATIAEKISIKLAGIPWLASYSAALGLACVVIPVAYLTLILGELVPKRIAFSRPERMALFVAPFMSVLMRLSAPAVFFLSISTKAVLRLLGFGPSVDQQVTEEDIKGLLAEAALSGVVETAEHSMFERIFRLGDRPVGAVMTHRLKIVWLDLEDAQDNNIRKMLSSPYSRFPVAKGDLTNSLGVVKAKEYLGAYASNPQARLTDFLHQPLVVTENMPALRLLDAFKTKERMHFALVVDEYGDILGIVTPNDILEAIVGEIPSMGEEPEPAAQRRVDGSWLVDGAMPMDEVVALLGSFEHSFKKGYYVTLAGFVLAHMGQVPQAGDRFKSNGWSFEVMDMDGHRVDKLLIVRVSGE